MSSLPPSHPHRPQGGTPIPQIPRLCAADRALIRTLLRHCDGAPPARQVAGILRDKLRIAEHAEEHELDCTARVNGWVSYMIAGGGARRGVLRHGGGLSDSGAIPLASLLGATLIGMRPRQRASLPRPDGSTVTLALLKAAPHPEGVAPLAQGPAPTRFHIRRKLS